MGPSISNRRNYQLRNTLVANPASSSMWGNGHDFGGDSNIAAGVILREDVAWPASCLWIFVHYAIFELVCHTTEPAVSRTRRLRNLAGYVATTPSGGNRSLLQLSGYDSPRGTMEQPFMTRYLIESTRISEDWQLQMVGPPEKYCEWWR
jgi:hypothetical protein